MSRHGDGVAGRGARVGYSMQVVKPKGETALRGQTEVVKPKGEQRPAT